MKPSCRNFRALIIDLQQGELLSPEDKTNLERHLAMCPDCQAFQRDIVRMFEEMGDEALPSLSDEFFQDMGEKIFHGLRDHIPNKIHGMRHFLNPLRPGWFSWRGIFVPVLSGICGILLGFFLATTQAPSPPTPKPIAAASKIQKTVASNPSNTSALVESLEDYVNIYEFLDSLDEQEMQALLREFSDEIPEALLKEMENGTG